MYNIMQPGDKYNIVHSHVIIPPSHDYDPPPPHDPHQSVHSQFVKTPLFKPVKLPHICRFDTRERDKHPGSPLATTISTVTPFPPTSESNPHLLRRPLPRTVAVAVAVGSNFVHPVRNTPLPVAPSSPGYSARCSPSPFPPSTSTLAPSHAEAGQSPP